MPDKIYLRQMQALPLIAKVHMSQARIREWYDHFGGDVCISFSGGKDSTVLAHLVHEMYPDVPMVFCNTGLEYPEIQDFARRMGAEFVRPKMRFDEVISKYGYPIISKETAEAIHYARKIRNIEGGGTAQQVSSRDGQAGEGQHSQIGSSSRTALRKRRELNDQRIQVGGGITDTHRQRSNLMNLRREYNAERQKALGLIGEDDASPG